MKPEEISAYSNLAMVIVTIVGLILAKFGYGGWKKHLTGKAEYETVRRLLKAVYKLREAINFVRSPWMSVSEMPAPPKDHPLATDDKRKGFYGVAKAYEKRWERVLEANTDLSAELLEAEVLFGEKIKDRYNKLFEIEKELYIALQKYLDSINPDKNYKYNNEDLDKVIYSWGGEDKNDEYFQKLKNAIGEIESILKPYLSERENPIKNNTTNKFTKNKYLGLIGLILNLLGTLLVIISIGGIPCTSSTSCGGTTYKIAYVLYPILLKSGLGIIILGFLLQLIKEHKT